MRYLIAIFLLLAASAQAETIRGNWSGQTTPTLTHRDGTTQTLYSYIAATTQPVTVSGNFCMPNARYVAGPWPQFDKRHYRPWPLRFPPNARVSGNFVNRKVIGGIAKGNFTLRVSGEETTTQTQHLLAEDGTTITVRWMGHRNRIFAGGNGVLKDIPEVLDSEFPERKRTFWTHKGVTRRRPFAKLQALRDAHLARTNAEILPGADE